jgi:CIC family chloride channel protein
MAELLHKLSVHPAGRMVILTGTALIIGTAAALAAIALLALVDALNTWLLVAPKARVQSEQLHWLVVTATLVVPTVGGLLVGLAHRYLSPAGRPLGPPDVILAVQFNTALPDVRSGLVSTATATLSLGAGAAVGQYGPMVYLGALIGDTARRLRLDVPNLPAIAVSCGVAAAIATAFNAPIAGLVFAHEVVLRHYATQAFAPVTVASATGYVISNVVLDRPALFLVTFEGVAHGYEFVLFAVLGLLMALAAVGFMRLLLRTGPALRRAIPRAEFRPAAAGLALGLTALALPDVLGIGRELVRFATIEGAFGGGELVVLIAARIVMTAVCLGAGFSGGVFSPALLIGSLWGALFWMGATGVLGIDTAGVPAYAIAGMMAFASAVIGAPLTCILIVFELTRSYDVTIAAMVAVVFSNLVSHRMFGRSLFDVQLAERGLDFSLGRHRARLASLTVRDLVNDTAVTARADEPATAVAVRLARHEWPRAFVTDAQGRLVGVFDAAAAEPATTVGAAARPAGIAFYEDTDLATAMEMMRGFSGDAVPVVGRDDGRYLGAVSEAALVSAWLDHSRRLREEENASL